MKSGFNNQRPVIFEYSDYRLFLRDLYLFFKASKPAQFSYRYFAREAGFTSPNFLKLVVEGERNLSAESIEKFSKAFKLTRDESRFFRALVQLNQAKTAEERKLCAKQLFRSRKFKTAQPLKLAQFHYFDHWYLIPIREMVAAPGFKENSEWIASRLNPAITADQARDAISDLLQIGLLTRDQTGRLVQTDALISTEDEVISSSVKSFHVEMIKKGSEAIERFVPQDREISAVILGLSHENAMRIKKLIQNFRKELLDISGEQQRVERVYQIGYQLFPLTEEIES